MKKIMVITDADQKGSGYWHLSIPLLQGLAELGYEIKVIGFQYKGEEHWWDFSILPAQDMQDVVATARNLETLWKPDVLIVLLDIPLQEQFLQHFQTRTYKYVGIFPVEAPPLCMDWAMAISQMDKALVISEFGAKEVQKIGIDAEHIQIGIDLDSWKAPTPEQRQELRDNFGLDEDVFVILTVADNQERKNLSRALEIVADFTYDHYPVTKEWLEEEKPKPSRKVQYLMVTREHFWAGWKLRSYAQDLGISLQLSIFERGISHQELWGLYSIADAFLLTSKAEGLCVLPNTKVWTGLGQKEIQDIYKGELVITHAGRLQFVDQVLQRDYDGEIIEIELSYGLQTIKITPEHPVYSIPRNENGRGNRRLSNHCPEWWQAKDLRRGDYIFYPKITREEYPEFINVHHYIDGVVDNGHIYPEGANQFGSKYKHATGIGVPERLYLNKGLMKLFGYYIAEGCSIGDGLSFSFHSDEIEYHNEVIEALKHNFNLETTNYDRSRHRYDIRVYSTLLSNLFESMFGKSSHEKQIPNWMLWLRKDLLWELVHAMFNGDGNYQTSGQHLLRYSTVSEQLAEQLQFALFKLGIVSTLKRASHRKEFTVTIHHPELFKVPFLDENEIPNIAKRSSRFIELEDGYMLPIKSIKTKSYSGKVYNLEVMIDNSYLLNGGIVHNCMPMLEAMAMKVPVVATDITAMAEHLQDGNNGYPIAYWKFPEFDDYIDPFGNELRGFAKRSDGAFALGMIENGTDVERSVQNGYEYVSKRTHQISVNQLHKALQSLDE